VIRCPRCRHESPPEATVCPGCGAPVGPSCASCGAGLPAGSRFCNQCGAPVKTAGLAPARYASPEAYTPKHLAEKILTSRTAVEGERKLVTVLFADLKGSMELLADRDPEEARKLLDPVLELMMEAVHRYEGTVNQVMGDGIMALFGAPVAHEDHAVRACYAALRMQESVKRYAEETRRSHDVEAQIRVGLNSGEVVVRSIGSDLHMDYTAVGQTTHLAARMEQMADPGTIVTTPATAVLAEGYVEVKSLGPAPVKGLDAPLELYEILGAFTVRSRFHAAAARGLTRFVGRMPEMEQLEEALAEARRGRGQVVAVVGGAGVGKSRLCYEFVHSPSVQGCLLIESASVSYGKATAYLPVIELLKAYFRIEDRDGPRAIREKVQGRLVSLDRELEPCLPALLWLLGAPVDDPAWVRLEPRERRQRTLDSVKRLIIRESQVQPVVALFEDLHWIDAETQALLDALVESLPRVRILLLANYRPEYQHAWGSKTYYRHLRMDPLLSANAGELLDALLGSDATVEPLKPLLVRRTEGTPLFLEETVRTLVETKTLAGERGAYRLVKPFAAIEVPASVKAMLAARIDRLPGGTKAVLQAASVIGADVPFAMLRAIAELPEDELRRHLTLLQAAEFLYETTLFPELEYTFKHALTHEVTYGGLLHGRRRELHARIVGAIERLYPDRLDEHVERLAHHALRGELPEKAVQYCREAGLKTAARSALRDARGWFEQALGALETLPESRSRLEQAFDLRLELRPVLTQVGEVRRSLDRLREAETLADRLSDDGRRGRAAAFRTATHSLLGELDEALVAGARARDVAERLGDLRLHIPVTTYLELAHYFRGDYARVVDLATDNLAALPPGWTYEDFGNAAPASIYDRAWLVMSLAELGRFADATAHAAEASRLAEPTNHAFTMGMVSWAAGTLHAIRGEWTKASSSIEQGIAVLRSANVALVLPTVVALSAWVLAQLGNGSLALSRVREGEALTERHVAGGIVGHCGWEYQALGRASLLLGRLDEAKRLAERAVESSPLQQGFAAHAWHVLGDIAAHPDRFDAARGQAHYRQALALAESRGMRPLVAHCHLGLGRLDRRAALREPAREHLVTAARMYRDMGMRFWLDLAEAETKE
jgi:class 3 adenylate cyclase/tetratricopeptide (TPR) repeat protein